MNVNTGEIMRFDNEQDLRKAMEKQNLVSVDEKDMTEKQKKLQKVSLHDNKSKLGKQLQKERKKFTKNQAKRLRRKTRGK